MNKKQEIKEFIERYFHVYFTERSFDKVKTFFSPEFTGIGTGLDEAAFTTEEMIDLYKRDLEQMPEPIQYKDLIIHVGAVSEHFAIVNCTFDIQGDTSEGLLFIPSLRVSFALSRIENDWKIALMHISVPLEEQGESESYPIKKLRMQNVLLEKMVMERTQNLNAVNRQLQISNATKDKFFSIIAHDLISPFTGLLGFTDILMTDYDDTDSEAHKEMISDIDQSSKKVYNLIKNLLDWSRSQLEGFKFNPSAHNLHNIADESIAVMEDMARGKAISIANKIDEVMTANCDKYMVSTILRNLISNAIKFTPNSGKITLTASTEASGSGDLIKVSINDTGVGIDPELLPNLFTLGQSSSTIGTNQETGTGLGLIICKEFVDFHGTEIWAESSFGKGTAFCFTLNAH